MTGKENQNDKAALLRKKAEAQFREKLSMQKEPRQPISAEEMQHLLHELRVHQIELEMQNEELRATEEALSVSQSRYFDLYDLAPVGYLVISKNGTILEANLTAAAMLGVPRGMLIKKLISSFIYNEDQNIYYHHRKKLFETGEPQDCEMRMLKPGGEPFWVQLVATTAMEKDSEPVCHVVMTDIGRRKQMENKLLESESFLNSIVENIPNMIFVKDVPDLRFVRLNKASEALLGIPRGEMYGKNDYDFWTQAEAEHFIENDRETLDKKELLDIPEEKLLTRKMGERILHSKKIPILDAAGNPKFLMGISEDITERKQAEEKLRESEKRYHSLFEDSPVALWEEDFSAVINHLEALKSRGATDIHAYLESHPKEIARCAALIRVLDINKAGLRLYKANKKEDLQDNLSKILFPESNITFLKELVLIAAGQKEFSGEGINYTLTGEPINVSIFWTATSGHEKDLSKVVVSIVDITENKRAEKALFISESKFSTAFRISPDSININRLSDGLYLEINEGFTALTGFTPEEVLGRTSSEINIWVNPQDRARLVKGLQEFGEVINLEAPFRIKNGGVKVCLMSARIIEIGQEKCILSITRDITDHKKMEEELGESEKRYRDMFEDSPVALWEEDFSAVINRLKALKARGVTDIHAYLESHPKEVARCIALIKVLDINKAGLKLYKAKDKDDLINNLPEILSPESNINFLDDLELIAAGQKEFSREDINQTLAGETINVSITWAAAPGHEKDLSRVMVSLVDITKRKKAETAMRESELRYHGLFEDSPVSLWEEDFSAVKQRLDALRKKGVTDLHAYLKKHPDEVEKCLSLVRVLDVNKATLALFKAKNKNELFENLPAILKQAKAGFADELEFLFEGKTAFVWEGINQTLAGETINVSISWAAAPGHEKDLSNVLVSIIDITERKRAEEEILANNERLRTLSEILQHQSKNTQDFLDYALEQTLNLTKSGLGYIYFYDEEKQEFTLNTWSSEVMQACRIQDAQSIYPLEKTGLWGEAVRQRKPIMVNDFQAQNPFLKGYPEGHAPLHNFLTIPIISDGEVVSVIGIANKASDYDETDLLQLTLLMDSVWKVVKQRQAEEALAEYSSHLEELVAERTCKLEVAQEELITKEKLATLGQLAGSVGHELRNPLGVISNAVYLLEANVSQENLKAREYTKMIAGQVQKSSKIIADLLNFAREPGASRASTNLSELVRQILGEYPTPENITVKTQFDSDLPNVFADRQHIEQILTNLVSNACQAMPQGGRLSIRAAQVKDSIHIAVKDSGVGILPENMQKLFSPLYTTKINGIGLGLPTSKKLAQVNGGRIDVKSTPGKGSTFSLILPIEGKSDGG